MAIPNAVCKKHDKETGDKTALDSQKLKQAAAVLKLSKALGGKFLKFFVYGAVEGDTLVIYLSHPSMVREFDGAKAGIIEKMREIYREEKMKDVVTFGKVIAKPKPQPAPKKETKEPYRDRATGNFEIDVQDEQLKKAFERVRKIIKEGHDAQ